jgi:hypothetical protein
MWNSDGAWLHVYLSKSLDDLDTCRRHSLASRISLWSRTPNVSIMVDRLLPLIWDGSSTFVLSPGLACVLEIWRHYDVL